MLKKISGNWQFASENNLEDFVWSQLNVLFGLLPLKRQYIASGDICDILAVDKNNRLVIIELKNVEDRYIIQQLTRYYHSILEEKPFQQQVNYQLPVRLIGIAPSFHRHSLIDKKYHELNFEFMSFVTVQQGNEVFLQITDLNTKKVLQAKIIDIAIAKIIRTLNARRVPLHLANTQIKTDTCECGF